jgi:hypothetical protein
MTLIVVIQEPLLLECILQQLHYVCDNIIEFGKELLKWRLICKEPRVQDTLQRFINKTSQDLAIRKIVFHKILETRIEEFESASSYTQKQTRFLQMGIFMIKHSYMFELKRFRNLTTAMIAEIDRFLEYGKNQPGMDHTFLQKINMVQNLFILHKSRMVRTTI